MSPTRPFLLVSVLLAVLGPLALAEPSAASDADHYANPLEPRIPGDGTVDSCADPVVLQEEQRRHAGVHQHEQRAREYPPGRHRTNLISAPSPAQAAPKRASIGRGARGRE